jgi:hypothetical protein
VIDVGQPVVNYTLSADASRVAEAGQSMPCQSQSSLFYSKQGLVSACSLKIILFASTDLPKLQGSRVTERMTFHDFLQQQQQQCCFVSRNFGLLKLF